MFNIPQLLPPESAMVFFYSAEGLAFTLDLILPGLDKLPEGAVPGFLYTVREETGREFLVSPMILETLTAKTCLVTRGIGTIAVFKVLFDIGTFLFHIVIGHSNNLLLLTGEMECACNTTFMSLFVKTPAGLFCTLDQGFDSFLLQETDRLFRHSHSPVHTGSDHQERQWLVDDILQIFLSQAVSLHTPPVSNDTIRKKDQVGTVNLSLNNDPPEIIGINMHPINPLM